MAYVSKEKKAKIAAELAKVLKPMGVKYTLAVRHHSTIVCTIRKAPVDLVANYFETCEPQYRREPVSVNPYHYENEFTGTFLEIVSKTIKALNTDNFDRSEPQFDYHCKGHYVDLQIGKYNKPFEIVA